MMDVDAFVEVYDSVPVAYYQWMFDRVCGCLADPVLEIGSGPGIITRMILDQGLHVTGIDLDPEILKRLEKMLEHEPGFMARPADAANDDLSSLPGAPFASVVCLNMLEHFEDDLKALQNFHRALRQGGGIAVLVPAFPGLYGSMDQKFGHFRRYRAKGIRELMERAGFSCRVEYFNLLGIPGWWWRFRVMKSESFSPRQNRVYNVMLPFLRAMEDRVRVPAGLSIIARGKKK